MIKIKKIFFNKKNFIYFFNIILFFRNDKDYLSINKIKKVDRNQSYKWLKQNYKKRIFFLLKFNNKNAGIINFNKAEKTFSQVVLKKYRGLGIGKKTYNLFKKYLKRKGYKSLTTLALKKNISAYKINSSFCYKKTNLKNGFTKFYIKL